MKNKFIKKIVKNLIDISFRDGKIIESQVGKSVRVLKTLPKSQAIEGLGVYVKELKMLQRQHTLFIESVIPLSNTQLLKIKKLVEKKTKITKILTQINPSILGGFILKVGDEVWDQSVFNQINQIKEVIAHGGSNSAN